MGRKLHLVIYEFAQNNTQNLLDKTKKQKLSQTENKLFTNIKLLNVYTWKEEINEQFPKFEYNTENKGRRINNRQI